MHAYYKCASQFSAHNRYASLSHLFLALALAHCLNFQKHKAQGTMYTILIVDNLCAIYLVNSLKLEQNIIVNSSHNSFVKIDEGKMCTNSLNSIMPLEKPPTIND